MPAVNKHNKPVAADFQINTDKRPNFVCLYLLHLSKTGKVIVTKLFTHREVNVFLCVCSFNTVKPNQKGKKFGIFKVDTPFSVFLNKSIFEKPCNYYCEGLLEQEGLVGKSKT